MYKNNLIAENKIIITTSDSSHILKIFVVVMPLYFFPNSPGC